MSNLIAETVVADTAKGKRVWLQGLERHGWHGGATYRTDYTPDAIVYTRTTVGKVRRVTASKGGIIDTVGKRVTQWAQGASVVQVYISSDGAQLTVMRVEGA